MAGSFYTSRLGLVRTTVPGWEFEPPNRIGCPEHKISSLKTCWTGQSNIFKVNQSIQISQISSYAQISVLNLECFFRFRSPCIFYGAKQFIYPKLLSAENLVRDIHSRKEMYRALCDLKVVTWKLFSFTKKWCGKFPCSFARKPINNHLADVWLKWKAWWFQSTQKNICPSDGRSMCRQYKPYSITDELMIW